MELNYQKFKNYSNLNKIGFVYPICSFDCVKLTYAIYVLFFERFFLDESFFSDENQNNPLYYLVLQFKQKFYNFLVFKNEKIESLIDFSQETYELIFLFYIKLIKKYDNKKTEVSYNFVHN